MANLSAQLLVAGSAGWPVSTGHRIPETRHCPSYPATAAALTTATTLYGMTPDAGAAARRVM
jgi:hypothetical protein